LIHFPFLDSSTKYHYNIIVPHHLGMYVGGIQAVREVEQVALSHCPILRHPYDYGDTSPMHNTIEALNQHGICETLSQSLRRLLLVQMQVEAFTQLFVFLSPKSLCDGSWIDRVHFVL
jgi:hypothetical protein